MVLSQSLFFVDTHLQSLDHGARKNCAKNKIFWELIEITIKALIYYAEHQSCPLDLNAQNSSEDTPMHLAAKWGFSKIVDILLSYDAR